MRVKTNDFLPRMRTAIERAGGPERLAEKVGVTHQAVYGWRAGSRPFQKRLPSIAAAANVSLEWLESGRGEMLPNYAERNPSSRVKEDMECPLNPGPATPTERMIELAAEKMTSADLSEYITRLLRDEKLARPERYQIAARLVPVLAHRIATERPPIKYN